MVTVWAVAACNSSATTPTSTTIPHVETALQAIEELHEDLIAGDFDAAGALTMPDHASLAALAEGATEDRVAAALESGDPQVAANFWSGFAQGAGEAFLGPVDLRDLGDVTEGSTAFSLVGVKPAGALERPMVTQDLAGHRIDLFASFGDGLAERMVEPVEGLLASGSDDATLILSRLQTVVDSLMLAAGSDAITPEASQSILQLVELITRFG